MQTWHIPTFFKNSKSNTSYGKPEKISDYCPILVLICIIKAHYVKRAYERKICNRSTNIYKILKMYSEKFYFRKGNSVEYTIADSVDQINESFKNSDHNFGAMKVLQIAEHKILLVKGRYMGLKKQILTRWEAVQQRGSNMFSSTMLVKLVCRKFYVEYYKVWFSNQYFFDVCKWSSVHFHFPIIILDKTFLLSLYFSSIHSYIISANLVWESTCTANLNKKI